MGLPNAAQCGRFGRQRDLERSSILELIEDEVIAPDVVLSLGAKLHDTILTLPQARSFLRPTDDL